jgi:hypothetical protein
MHEGMLGVARDGVHMLDDGLGTLALRPHYHDRCVSLRIRVQYREHKQGGQKRASYTTPRTFGGFAQSPFKIGAPSASISCNDGFEGAGTHTWGIYL